MSAHIIIPAKINRGNLTYEHFAQYEPSLGDNQYIVYWLDQNGVLYADVRTIRQHGKVNKIGLEGRSL